MQIPDLADLIWLFEDDPITEDDDLHWPVGLHTFRLTRGITTVHFSLDPLAADADISVLVAGTPVAHLGRLRRLDRLTVLRRPSDYEGVQLWFADAHEPLTLQTKPGILLSWDVRALGEW